MLYTMRNAGLLLSYFRTNLDYYDNNEINKQQFIDLMEDFIKDNTEQN